jgi:hypothetical protein
LFCAAGVFDPALLEPFGDCRGISISPPCDTRTPQRGHGVPKTHMKQLSEATEQELCGSIIDGEIALQCLINALTRH